MANLKKGDRVLIQTEDPESALNGAWGIVQSSKHNEVMVAIEGLVTEANTLPFDASELTKIASEPKVCVDCYSTDEEPHADNCESGQRGPVNSLEIVDVTSEYLGADRE